MPTAGPLGKTPPQLRRAGIPNTPPFFDAWDPEADSGKSEVRWQSE